jgi:hypothetical protein
MSEKSGKENDAGSSQLGKPNEPKSNLVILESDLPRFSRDSFTKAWRLLGRERDTDSEDELKTGTD